MGMNFTTGDYGDFKTVIAQHPQQGKVFYSNPGGSWTIVWVPSDFGSAFSISSNITFPASFAADFPNAIALSSAMTGNNWVAV